MNIQVRRFDPHDEDVLHQWWAAGRDARAERAEYHYPSWETARVAVPLQQPDADNVFFGAFEGDRLVGAGFGSMPLAGNRHLVFGDALVAPAERGRGVGASLEAELVRIAREAGRTTLMATAPSPPDVESPGLRFGLARGYRVGNVEEKKVVDLAATEATWPALGVQAAERAGGFTLASWRGPTPGEYVDDVCELASRFMDEIPLGDLTLEAETWTPERLAAAEQRRVDQGREALTVVALDDRGRIVGLSDLTVHVGDPQRAEIGVTQVEERARGHRLGLAMKVRLHQELRTSSPGTRTIGTSNALSNTHMNAVNAVLGYVGVERLNDLEKSL